MKVGVPATERRSSGASRAHEMMLTGRKLSSAEALAAGLVLAGILGFAAAFAVIRLTEMLSK